MTQAGLVDDGIEDPVLEDVAPAAVVPDVAVDTDVTPAPAPAPPAPAPEGPFDLPEELRRPEPAPQDGISAAERQELDQLRRRSAEVEAASTEVRRAGELRQMEQAYMTQYQLDEQTAKFVSEQVRQERERGDTALRNVTAERGFEERRRNAAAIIGKEKGVSPSALLQTRSEEEMRARADDIVYMAQQSQRIAVLEKGRVPDNTFDNGSGNTGGAQTAAALMDYYGTPNVTTGEYPEITEAHRKILTDAGHGQG